MTSDDDVGDDIDDDVVFDDIDDDNVVVVDDHGYGT